MHVLRCLIAVQESVAAESERVTLPCITALQANLFSGLGENSELKTG